YAILLTPARPDRNGFLSAMLVVTRGASPELRRFAAIQCLASVRHGLSFFSRIIVRPRYLFLHPPFAKRLAAPGAVKAENKNAVELDPGDSGNPNNRRPPVDDTLIGREYLEGEMDLRLRARDM